MEEVERKKIIQNVLEDNLVPPSTIAFLNKQNPEAAKELIKTSIDTSLLNLYEKTEKGDFYLKNFEEFTDFYKNKYYDSKDFPKELVPHLEDHILHKVSIGEMKPLFKEEEVKVEKEDPHAVLTSVFLRALDDPTKKKLLKSNETGLRPEFISEIKDKIIKELNENIDRFSKTGGYELNLSHLNFHFQNSVRGLHSSINQKLTLDDHSKDIEEINKRIKLLTKKQEEAERKKIEAPKNEEQMEKQPPGPKKPEYEGFTLAELEEAKEPGVVEIEKTGAVQESKKEAGKHEVKEKEKPSISLFLKTFFVFTRSEKGRQMAVAKKDLLDSEGKIVKGKKLFEMAKNLTDDYVSFHDLKKLERNPMLLKKDEEKKTLLLKDDKTIKSLIDNLRKKNPENTTDPEQLERYTYILLALNLLHSRLSEITTPFMKTQFTTA